MMNFRSARRGRSVGFFLIPFLLLVSFQSVQAAPPTGFATETIVDDHLEFPTGFALAPDGRIFIVEQAGGIHIVKNGELLDRAFDELPAFASADRGLLGIAFDPEFETNHYVYFYYVDLDLTNRIVRFDASTDIGQDGPVEIYRADQQPANIAHAGGTITFGPDDKLYLALGDNTNPGNSQNMAVPYGKVLRLNKDGSIPSDNPFVGESGKLPEIWASGVRNPFRFRFDSVTDELILGDVGQDTWEEVNIIKKGKNYGWPAAEGVCSGCPYENPIYVYPHAGSGASITGGPVYRDDQFPAEYQGKYFFADYARYFIKTLDPYAASPVATDFDTDAGTVVDLQVGPDGSLYYLTIFPGTLKRIYSTVGNQPPVPSVSADPTDGPEPLTVDFSSVGTTDPEDDPLDYLWNFGDGTTSTEENPTKIYTVPGRYTVRLSVNDGEHDIQSAPLVIQVGTPPTVDILSPDSGEQYRGGEVFDYEIAAEDALGNSLDDDQVSVEVTFHHNTHMHPFVRPVEGKDGSFTIPTDGETATDVYYLLTATATDGSGLQSTATRRINPNLVNVTVNTSPAGLDFTLDGATLPTPRTFQTVAGITRRIGINDQALGSTGYIFDRWSDGETREHIIRPLTATTYTATLAPTTPFNAEYFANATLAGSPILTRFDPSVNFDWGGESPAPGTVPADNFSVRWTKSATFGAGEYEFRITTDDGARLYLDDTLVIDAWRHQAPTEYQARRILSAGAHTIRMEYYDVGGGAVARLSWDPLSGTPPPPPPTPTDGFAAKYYANRDLAGSPVLTRTDATVDFDWGFGSPDPLVPTDNFSAEWTRDIDFAAGEYEFAVTADDGVRLFIDGVAVIDRFVDQAATRYTVRRTLTAGVHAVKLQFYDRTEDAVMKFDYSPVSVTPPPPVPTDGFAAKYYANRDLAGSPVLTRTDATIDFDWALGSPAPSVPNNDFSAEWTRDIDFAAGEYEFAVTADDGVRLFIDGVLVIDRFVDQSATRYTVRRTLSAGSHAVKLQYYERGGDAVMKFNYTPVVVTPPPVPGSGPWAVAYYPNTTLSGSPVHTSDVETIDFDWILGSPAPAVPSDNFSARFTRTVVSPGADHAYTVTADDGVRIKADGVVILDRFVDQPATTYTGTIPLTPGSHTIVVEYYEKGGEAVIAFDLDMPPVTNTAFTSEFWDIAPFSGTPVFPVTSPDLTRTDAAIDFDWGTGSPDPSLASDHFLARFTKTVGVVTAGTYDIEVTADDGVRVKIDGALVLDRWIDQPRTRYTLSLPLAAGDHSLVIEYYEKGGDAEMRFGLARQPDALPIRAAYFANTDLAGTPVLVRDEAKIDYVFGFGSPHPSIPSDRFSAEYTWTETLAAGTYQMTLVSDDGVRLYVDGNLVHEDWTLHAPRTATIPITLSAGPHSYRLQYFENEVDATLKFSQTGP